MKMKPAAVALFLLAVMLFGSCSSVPLPGSSTESLFVISTEMESSLGVRNGRRRQANRVSMAMENMETGKTKKFYFSSRDEYVALPLEPGRYKLSTKAYVDMSENPGGNWTSDEYINSSPVLVEPTTVFISPYVVKLSSDGRGWFNLSVYNSNSNANVLRKAAVEDIFNDRRYKAWELYQVVGWEMPEEE